MSEPFVGEIRMFAGNFAPRGWAYCDGQLLSTSQNDALFSLLGTVYGGNGRTTFGLPDLRGRLPIHAGSGSGLSPRNLGCKGGTETVTLNVNQLPSHTHNLQASNAPASVLSPGDALLAQSQADIYNEEDDSEALATSAVSNTGNTNHHTNLMPFLCVHFIIALVGIYPSRH